MSEFKLQITKAKNAGLFILRKGKRRKKERKGKKFRVGPETIVQGEGDKDLETVPYRFVYLNHFFLHLNINHLRY